MAQLSGGGRSDISDRPARRLGQVSIEDGSQDEVLALILNELRRISVLLADMSGLDIDLDEIVE